MDMARTPGLMRTASSADLEVGRSDGARLVSFDEACSPEFVAAWETLASNACEPNPFFEHWFVLPSLNAFGSGGSVFFLAHYSHGQLTGLLPVGRARNYYGYPIPHATSWLHDNAFCGAPLVAHGHERQFWRGMFEHLDQHPKSAMFLHVPHLPAEGPLQAALSDVLFEQSRASFAVLNNSRALLASDLSSGEYLSQSMSTKKRKELRRQHKRLSEEGVLTFVRHDDAKDVEQWTTDFLALEAAGWKGEAGSSLAGSSHTSSFFKETLAQSANAGKLERLTLVLDDRPIAMLANFITVPGVYSFKTAFDEAYARFSPGMLIQLENLALLDRDDIKWADSCASEGHPMIERLWREKRTLKGYNIAIGGTLRRAVFRTLMAYETRGRSSS